MVLVAKYDPTNLQAKPDGISPASLSMNENALHAPLRRHNSAHSAFDSANTQPAGCPPGPKVVCLVVPSINLMGVGMIHTSGAR